MISYAQNFEDVMLWRALRHVERGFYIDVGAQDPVVDSVSLAFYEQGWRGVHVEPNARYAEMLREKRPDEEVMQVAVSDDEGIVSFHEIPGTGLSTLEEDIARRHAERGFGSRKVTLATVRLDAILARYADREVHWLKIDVEGAERSVLASWARKQARPKPWIVVVESTAPMMQIETAAAWEQLLLKRGYAHAYFDGLNRFYVSSEHPELLDAFRCPPNVFDGFELSGTASSSFGARVKAEVAARESARQAEAALRDELAREQARANAEIASARERAQAQVVDAQDRAHGEVAAAREQARAQIIDEQHRAQVAFDAERERGEARIVDERHRARAELEEARVLWQAELSAERERVRTEHAAERAAWEEAWRGELDRAGAEHAAREEAWRGELDRAGAERAELERRLLAAAEALAALRADAAGKDAAIASLQADAHALHERIGNLEERNRDAALQATAAERHAAQLDSQLVGATAEVLHLREHHRQAQLRLGALDSRLATVQSAYDAIERSRSWRLMAPLRTLAWMARRARAGLGRAARLVIALPRRATKRVLLAALGRLRDNPQAKAHVAGVLNRFPGLNLRFRRFARNHPAGSPAGQPLAAVQNQVQSPLPASFPVAPAAANTTGDEKARPDGSGNGAAEGQRAWRYGKRMNG